MSGVAVESRQKHPEGKKLSEALADDQARKKAQKGLIDKKATMIKAADGVEGDLGVGATMRPSDEQLAAINGFTRKTVTADEVVCFDTLSCNDIVDRDDDQFKAACIKDFSEMQQPYSSVGKSFMLDHAYKTENQVGRIFSVDAKKDKGVNWLTNGVYIPNTEKNAGLIEDIDFGISWAVSVGVVLGADSCTVCDAGFSSWGWWCQNGHDKGAYYDPNSSEEDAWGYPLPCDPKTKGAVKCVRQFSDPKDFYELSQVFLGAQYFAALDKDPAFKSVMKAATAKLPIIGLSAEEARKLPLRHESPKVSEARILFGVTEDETDGSINWTDAQGLRWSVDPEAPESEPLCLGKEAPTNKEEEDDDGNGQREVPDESLDAGDSGDDEGSEPESDDESGDGGQGSEGDQADPSGDEQGSEEGEVDLDAADEDESDEEGDEDETADKQAVLAAAKKAKVSETAIAALRASKGLGLDALLVTLSSENAALIKSVADLTPKAEIGSQYLAQLRAEAIDWYCKANATNEDPKVSTTTFEKILDRCDGDVDLLQELAEEQKKTAQAKFPKSVRRSSFPSDPHSLEEKAEAKVPSFEEGGDDNDVRVQRIHG